MIGNEKEWIQKLEDEGFIDVRVCPIPPNQDMPEHRHDQHTVHVIIDGGLTITDTMGTRTFGPGDRIDFPPGTVHKAKGETDNGRMIIGVKPVM
jgi:quercetin dioxygenase-like cupin family protein